MGALGGPPEEIGHKVAAALVGTFLGILLCYGLVGPVAANMVKTADDEHAYYQVSRRSHPSWPWKSVGARSQAMCARPSRRWSRPVVAAERSRRLRVRAGLHPPHGWPMSGNQSIIIIKKKAGHDGHHGGAWKVAYADFVTAMMALFIVLWLMNSSKQVQEAVAGYFKDPTGTSKMVGSNLQGSGEAFALSWQDMPKLKEELQKAIRRIDNFEQLKNQIEMTVTAEGLRIELLESETGTFFKTGSAIPSPNGREMLIERTQRAD
jgi:hypothetical protein